MVTSGEWLVSYKNYERHSWALAHFLRPLRQAEGLVYVLMHTFAPTARFSVFKLVLKYCMLSFFFALTKG